MRRLLCTLAAVAAFAPATALADDAEPVLPFSPPPPPDTPGFSVRAIGDSVTAGFGFSSTGEQFGLPALLDCRERMPTSDCDGRNAVSYPAEWARSHGIADVDNLAVSFAQPVDWMSSQVEGDGRGRYEDRLDAVIEDDPDLLFSTLGANPFLVTLYRLVGDADAIACVESPEARACAERWLERSQLREKLQYVYTHILAHTRKTRIVALEYPGAHPPVLHGDPDVLLPILNAQIESAVRTIRQTRPDLGRRIIVVPAPAGFAEHSLPDLSSMLLSPAERVWDPARSGPVDLWVLNNDGGIHPNRRGIRELAGGLDRHIWGHLPDATVAVGEASSVGGASAKLNATLDSGGFDTAYRVEYGREPGSYNQATPNVWVGRQPGPLPWSAIVDRLTPATVYYYRFVVTQQVGDTVKVTRSEPRSFTTALLRAERSEPISTRIAADGRVDVAYAVEYGPTAAYGRTTGRRSIGRPATATELVEVLSHLEPGTTYHYRFVVTRQTGDRVRIERTPDQSFVTGG